MTEKKERISILLPNHLGDVVMATPALRSLREGYPAACITAVVRQELAPILGGCPWIDEVIPHGLYQIRNPVGRLRARRRLARRMKRPDRVLVMPNSFSSGLLAAWSGAPERTGYRRRGRGWLLSNAVAPPKQKRRFRPVAMERYYLDLVAALGCNAADTRLELFCEPDAESAAELRLTQRGIVPGRPLVALAPGAAFGPSKLWPAASYAALARELIRNRAQVGLIHAPGEEPLAEAIVRAAGPEVVSVGGAGMTLSLLKSVVRKSDLVICNDAGARHIAAAFRVPAIVLMGPTSLDYTNLNLGRTRILRTDLPCQPCQLKVCPIDHRCMTGLLPERVLDEALAVLRDPTWSGDVELEGHA